MFAIVNTVNMEKTPQKPRTLLQLDPWMPEYEGSVEIDPAEVSVAGIDCTVEKPDWRAVEQSCPYAMPTFYFIDGVRRTDARVMAWSSGGLIHGLLGTVASGAVRSNGLDAMFDRCDVCRFLILGGGHRRSAVMTVGEFEVEFEGVASIGSAPADLGGELQELMRQLEAKVAESVIGSDNLVFIDGPLAYISSLGAVVGVIKRISQPYLDTGRFALVTSLGIGQRTPLFLISDGKRDRYSWYLRIGQRRHFDHVLTGIVRLEVRAVAGLETAKQLATISAWSLVRFASVGARDPRAPQNLVPVGALEAELRRRMGDPLIVRRAIEKRICEGVEL